MLARRAALLTNRDPARPGCGDPTAQRTVVQENDTGYEAAGDRVVSPGPSR